MVHRSFCFTHTHFTHAYTHTSINISHNPIREELLISPSVKWGPEQQGACSGSCPSNELDFESRKFCFNHRTVFSPLNSNQISEQLISPSPCVGAMQSGGCMRFVLPETPCSLKWEGISISACQLSVPRQVTQLFWAPASQVCCEEERRQLKQIDKMTATH
jgi:hypothetical protein